DRAASRSQEDSSGRTDAWRRHQFAHEQNLTRVVEHRSPGPSIRSAAGSQVTLMCNRADLSLRRPDVDTLGARRAKERDTNAFFPSDVPSERNLARIVDPGIHQIVEPSPARSLIAGRNDLGNCSRRFCCEETLS